MLDKHTKRMIAEATLYDEIGGMMFRYEDMEDVWGLSQSVTVLKSWIGYVVNETYDGFMEASKDYNDFVITVFTEIDDEYIRLMIMLLYNKISIEDEINKYVLNIIDKY